MHLFNIKLLLAPRTFAELSDAELAGRDGKREKSSACFVCLDNAFLPCQAAHRLRGETSRPQIAPMQV